MLSTGQFLKMPKVHKYLYALKYSNFISILSSLNIDPEIPAMFPFYTIIPWRSDIEIQGHI